MFSSLPSASKIYVKSSKTRHKLPGVKKRHKKVTTETCEVSESKDHDTLVSTLGNNFETSVESEFSCNEENENQNDIPETPKVEECISPIVNKSRRDSYKESVDISRDFSESSVIVDEKCDKSNIDDVNHSPLIENECLDDLTTETSPKIDITQETQINDDAITQIIPENRLPEIHIEEVTNFGEIVENESEVVTNHYPEDETITNAKPTQNTSFLSENQVDEDFDVLLACGTTYSVEVDVHNVENQDCQESDVNFEESGVKVEEPDVKVEQEPKDESMTISEIENQIEIDPINENDKNTSPIEELNEQPQSENIALNPVNETDQNNSPDVQDEQLVPEAELNCAENVSTDTKPQNDALCNTEPELLNIEPKTDKETQSLYVDADASDLLENIVPKRFHIEHENRASSLPDIKKLNKIDAKSKSDNSLENEVKLKHDKSTNVSIRAICYRCLEKPPYEFGGSRNAERPKCKFESKCVSVSFEDLASEMLENLPSITVMQARSRSYVVGSVRASGSLLGHEELLRLFPDKEVTVYVGTWNMNGHDPPKCVNDFLLPLNITKVPDICVVGTQESMNSRSEWEVLIQTTLGPSHVLFTSNSLGVLHLAVFIRRDLIWFCSEPEEAKVATRPGTMVKTKGAVAISFLFFGTSFLFINSHLTAHEKNLKERFTDYEKICSMLDIPKSFLLRPQYRSKDVTSRFDCVFWFGDLNFRVVQERSCVMNFLQKRIGSSLPSCNILMKYDQLLKAMAEGIAFHGFKEAVINFIPSYKFDVGTDHFDSMKLRVPSYTDRILFRSKENQTIFCTHYDVVPNIHTSDHKPVYAVFQVAVKPGRDNIPLAAGMFRRDVYLEAIRRRADALKVIHDNAQSTICSVM